MSRAAGDYSVVLPTVGLAQLEGEVIHLATTLDADGARAQASLVRRAYIRYLDDLNEIARETAALAHRYIVEEEQASRVRPNSSGDGGPRLEDFVGQSHPLMTVEGSVGINFEPALYSNVPWWWTNEEGYSGHVGRVVHGFFYDAGFTGRSRPDPGRSREHPLFRAEGPQKSEGHRQEKKSAPRKSAKGQRPGMLIRNPIPARRFVQRGSAKAEAQWHAKIKAAKARLMAEVERAVRSAPPPKPRSRARRGPGRRP